MATHVKHQALNHDAARLEGGERIFSAMRTARASLIRRMQRKSVRRAAAISLAGIGLATLTGVVTVAVWRYMQQKPVDTAIEQEKSTLALDEAIIEELEEAPLGR